MLPEENAVVWYSLLPGPGYELFSINPYTGVIATASYLDREQQHRFALRGRTHTHAARGSPEVAEGESTEPVSAFLTVFSFPLWQLGPVITPSLLFFFRMVYHNIGAVNSVMNNSVK